MYLLILSLKWTTVAQQWSMMIFLVWFFHILDMSHLFFQYMLAIYYSNNEILTDFSASKKNKWIIFMESKHKLGIHSTQNHLRQKAIAAKVPLSLFSLK